ncbi:hypothetical protein [Allorhodopirellula solitaria]|nr:hypothetical protein [Allorhodopirellula solitaria]
MNTDTPTPLQPSPFLPLCLGFVAGAALVGAAWILLGPSRPGHFHDMTVDYMYETSPGTATGSSSLEVESLEIHPEFVLLTDARGESRLMMLSRLRKLHFKPTAK